MPNSHQEPERVAAAAAVRRSDGSDAGFVGAEARWHQAYRDGDIRGCHRILAEAGGRIPRDRREAMSEALQALIDDRKRTMRMEFAALVRAGRYGKAIAKGREIAKEFPNSPMASEFHRLLPHLAARAATATSQAAEA
jgi:hypothetical protein